MKLVGPFVAVDVKVAGWPAVGLAETVKEATGTPDEAPGSETAVSANGSPETLLMTEAKERIGWSLVNSRKRFVSARETGGAKSVEKRLICLNLRGRCRARTRRRRRACRPPSGGSR